MDVAQARAIQSKCIFPLILRDYISSVKYIRWNKIAWDGKQNDFIFSVIRDWLINLDENRYFTFTNETNLKADNMQLRKLHLDQSDAKLLKQQCHKR